MKYFHAAALFRRQVLPYRANFQNHAKRTFCTCYCTQQFFTIPRSFSVDSKSSFDITSDFSVDRIRNFSIVAHVDHGKSTLSDRMLEITGTIPQNSANAQVLDKLPVERERGITVKAQTASMVFKYKGQTYLLNLIDTPGHVDFNFEVARSLAASDGAVLLVDANQGVQAQTVANFWLAFERDLKIIPVLNKIDLKEAKPEVVIEEIFSLFELPPEDCIKVSAKLGTGVADLLAAIVDRVPPPKADREKPLCAYVFDSWFEPFKGAYAFVVIKDGVVERGHKIISLQTKKEFEVQEVGIMRPNAVPVSKLYAGQVGYILANMKASNDAIVGDTLAWAKSPDVKAMPGFRAVKPMVFAGLFPVETTDFGSLKNALEKLCLNDASVVLETDYSPALGQGWRTGFLGLLHMEVFHQRLEQEYDESVIITAPSVPYKAKIKPNEGIRKRYGGAGEILIVDPSTFPDPPDIEEYQEPLVLATVIAPAEYYGKILSLCMSRRAQQESISYINANRMILKFVMPLAEIVLDFFDQLKSVSSGYASLDYEDAGWRSADLVKLNVLLNGKCIEEFSVIVPRSEARSFGRQLCTKLAEEIPRQQFDIAIQAAIGGKIMARQNIKATRKDVVGKGGKFGTFGGDSTRRMKLLANQAEGKKRMKLLGQVEVPKETFLNILKVQR